MSLSTDTPSERSITIEEGKGEETKRVIPEGHSKSWRIWRKKHEEKFSSFATNGALKIKTTWEEKEEKRKKLARIKELERSMKDNRKEQKKMKLQAIEERKNRQAQNELKSAKVQVIKDGNKLKKMSKKQLKQFKKTRIDKNGNVEYVDVYAK